MAINRIREISVVAAAKALEARYQLHFSDTAHISATSAKTKASKRRTPNAQRTSQKENREENIKSMKRA